MIQVTIVCMAKRFHHYLGPGRIPNTQKTSFVLIRDAHISIYIILYRSEII